MSEQELVFVPKKEGEEIPEGLWIPNRKQRRALMKNRKKIQQHASEEAVAYLNAVEEYSKTDGNFKQQIYKALLERIKEREGDFYDVGNSTEGD